MSDTLPLDPLLLDWDPSPLDQDPLLLETLNDSLYDGNYITLFIISVHEHILIDGHSANTDFPDYFSHMDRNVNKTSSILKMRECFGMINCYA